MARVRFILVVILFGAIVIFAGGVTPADAVSCGDILGPGGNFQLLQNLDCSPGLQALTVKDGAILNLNGHIVTCQIPTFPCIVLSGTGAQLHDGVVRGAVHENLFVIGTGHTVKNVTSVGLPFPARVTDGNVVVFGDNNRLINVVAQSIISSAFSILGNNNQLSDSIAQCADLTFGACIDIDGDKNRVIDNFVGPLTSVPVDRAGLSIEGSYNVVRRNRVIGNSGGFFSLGVVVSGTGNDLRHNTALQNAVDLGDANGNCVQNTWKFNTFQTAVPACIQ